MGSLRILEGAHVEAGQVVDVADGGADHARADVRQPREIEQALDRAVFAKRAVQDGENDVHAQRRGALIVHGNERRDAGVRG